MANTYGGSSKRQKICYDNSGYQACGEYFSVTNLETNQTEWHQDNTIRFGGMWGLQGPESSEVIGIYDPKTKKFKPTDNALASQKAYFTSQAGTQVIANNAKTTNIKSAIENGSSPAEAQKQAQEISKGNFQNNPNNNESEGSSSVANIIDTNEDKINTRNDFGKGKALIYPINLSSTQDTLKFQMIKYMPKGFMNDKKEWGGIDRPNAGVGRDILGTVILPIPGGIKDSTKVEWGGDDMNALKMAAAGFAAGTIEGGTEGAAESLTDTINALKKTGGKTMGDMVKDGFTAAAIGKDFKTIMARQTGMIMNPNMELLFTGPSLRPFSFNFLLAPRSKKEAKEVMKIIRFFKQGMAPIRSKANLFLKSPHTFQLQYRHKDNNHPYLNSFKECALESCEVNYTPEQSYSTYEDGVMIAYTLSLGFKELEPVYNDDYGNSGDLPSNLNLTSTTGVDVQNLTNQERDKLAGKIVPDISGGNSYVFDAQTQAALDALADK